MSSGCRHPLHLNYNDARFLRALRVVRWTCPACTTSDERDEMSAPRDSDVDTEG